MLMSVFRFLIVAVFGVFTLTGFSAGIEWQTLTDESMALTQKGEFERAEVLSQKALALAAISAASDPITHAQSFAYLGTLQVRLQKLAEAAVNFKSALRIFEAELPFGHDDVVLLVTALAMLYEHQMQLEFALPYYQKLLAIQERKHGQEHFNVVPALIQLARCYLGVESAIAARLAGRAVVITEKNFGSDDDRLAAVLVLAAQYADSRAETERQLTRSISITEKRYGPNHINVLEPLSQLGNLLVIQRKFLHAKDIYGKAEAAVERNADVGGEIKGRIWKGLGEVYDGMRQEEKAEKYYLRALDELEKNERAGVVRLDLATVRTRLFNIYLAQKRTVDIQALRAREFKNKQR